MTVPAPFAVCSSADQTVWGMSKRGAAVRVGLEASSEMAEEAGDSVLVIADQVKLGVPVLG